MHEGSFAALLIVVVVRILFHEGTAVTTLLDCPTPVSYTAGLSYHMWGHYSTISHVHIYVQYMRRTNTHAYII